MWDACEQGKKDKVFKIQWSTIVKATGGYTQLIDLVAPLLPTHTT